MSFHLQKLSREERLCNDNTVNVDSNDVCLQVEPNFGIILSLALASAGLNKRKNGWGICNEQSLFCPIVDS